MRQIAGDISPRRSHPNSHESAASLRREPKLL